MDLLVKFFADDALIIIVLVAAFILGRQVMHNRRIVPIIVMAGLTSLMAGKFLSLLYQPTTLRPFLEKGVDAGASYINNPGFPSDHALLGTVIVIAVHMTVRSLRLTACLAILLLFMCAARVLALVHTPLDIAGGVVAGFAGIYWYRKLTK